VGVFGAGDALSLIHAKFFYHGGGQICCRLRPGMFIYGWYKNEEVSDNPKKI